MVTFVSAAHCIEGERRVRNSARFCVLHLSWETDSHKARPEKPGSCVVFFFAVVVEETLLFDGPLMQAAEERSAPLQEQRAQGAIAKTRRAADKVERLETPSCLTTGGASPCQLSRQCGHRKDE